MTASPPQQGFRPVASSRGSVHAPKQWQNERKLVVLTGASGGIGALIGQTLLSQGYDLIAVCRSTPDLDYDRTLHIACDFARTETLASVSETIEQCDRPVFALIHCAGLITPSPLAEAESAAIEAQIALNLTAPVLLTRHLLPLMSRGASKEKAGGHIIFVNSMAAVMPLAGSAAYAAAKAGLRSFALSLAQELRPTNLSVSTVFPGAVQTSMLHREMAEGGSVLNYVSTPLNPSKVAQAVVNQLGRNRQNTCREQFMPAIDGVFGKMCMAAPALLRLTLPVLYAIGRRNYAKVRHRG
ncbi:SDR family NAD(P)-dependent oxidoreductase [Asaia bogorensis]|uniref:SDR family NAD(P)-dependent oxidoreductase n=1 Tax=Asaia bogorensis TaxID=91915 RepID=UPI00285585D6|nr:SDR family NAD(P)-dependent oxidoreductase [Asaia bogorensis]MDR6183710.1 short-subunit dehydrogenase [Asaia bogorensis NBRC 16594]